MKPRRSAAWHLLLLSLACAGLMRAATTAPAHVTFDRLELTDGRRLKNVVVRSFDRAAGKLLVIADGKAMLLPVSAIPVSLHPKIAEYVPPTGETVSTISAPRPIATAADQYEGQNPGRAPIERPTPPPQIYGRAPQPAVHPAQPTSNQLLAAQSGADVPAHKAAAIKRAEAYFRFEYRVGSDAATVTGLDVDVLSPKPVPGWEGRFRTEGKALLEFYDSRGRSFQRRASSFEVVTEKKVGSDDLIVIEFTPKS